MKQWNVRPSVVPISLIVVLLLTLVVGPGCGGGDEVSEEPEENATGLRIILMIELPEVTANPSHAKERVAALGDVVSKLKGAPFGDDDAVCQQIISGIEELEGLCEQSADPTQIAGKATELLRLAQRLPAPAGSGGLPLPGLPTTPP